MKRRKKGSQIVPQKHFTTAFSKIEVKKDYSKICVEGPVNIALFSQTVEKREKFYPREIERD